MRYLSINNRTYAVPDPEGISASGWAEETRSFHKKIHNVNFFVKRKKAYHAAAGESGFWGSQQTKIDGTA